jgi:hypothetical protein
MSYSQYEQKMERPRPCHVSGSTCSICVNTEGRMKSRMTESRIGEEVANGLIIGLIIHRDILNNNHYLRHDYNYFNTQRFPITSIYNLN